MPEAELVVDAARGPALPVDVQVLERNVFEAAEDEHHRLGIVRRDAQPAHDDVAHRLREAFLLYSASETAEGIAVATADAQRHAGIDAGAAVVANVDRAVLDRDVANEHQESLR